MDGHPWQIFPTVTSQNQTHPEALLKRWGYMWSLVNRDLYGNNWSRRGEGVRWIVGVERHKSWRPHLHGMVYAPGFDLTDPLVFPFSRWQPDFTATGGNVDLKVIRAREAVLAYVTKYVLKDGEIQWSDGLGKTAAVTNPPGQQAEGSARRAGAPSACARGFIPETDSGQRSMQFGHLRARQTLPARGL